MPLNIACQMDPIESIDVPGDSTLALLLAAQDRGHKIFYYTPSNLSLRDGRLLARGATLTVRDEPGNHFDLSDHRVVDLADLDVVLLRQDPPFDMGYITTTHCSSASTRRRWSSTTRRTCAMRRKRSSCSISAT